MKIEGQDRHAHGQEVSPTDLEQLRERLARIEDPLALLTGIFAYSPFGIQIYEPGGRSILTNRAFRDMFGSEPPPGYNVLTDEVAKSLGVLDLIHRAFRGETVHVPPIWYDPRLLKQVTVEGGRRAAIESTFFPIKDADGEITHVAIVFKDLTRELELREAAERERDLLQRLIGVLGHDLRTPLTAILGTVTRLLKHAPPHDGLQAGLLRVRQSAGRMNRLIANVLDLTQMRVGGSLPVTVTETDLEDVARTLVDEIGIAYPDRRIVVTCSGDTRGRFDPDRVSQLLANLITNAITYGEWGAPIAVKVSDRNGSVALTVHNQGPAIPAEDLAHLFEAFHRGSGGGNVGASPGLGLGLFIAHEIAGAHGGTISVTSSAEHGTAFEVLLPRTLTA